MHDLNASPPDPPVRNGSPKLFIVLCKWLTSSPDVGWRREVVSPRWRLRVGRPVSLLSSRHPSLPPSPSQLGLPDSLEPPVTPPAYGCVSVPSAVSTQLYSCQPVNTTDGHVCNLRRDVTIYRRHPAPPPPPPPPSSVIVRSVGRCPLYNPGVGSTQERVS